MMSIGPHVSTLNLSTHEEEDRADIHSKISTLLESIEREPKNIKWKMRARVGDKAKWYDEVEEVERGLTGRIA